jgi:hypothetical protein
MTMNEHAHNACWCCLSSKQEDHVFTMYVVVSVQYANCNNCKMEFNAAAAVFCCHCCLLQCWVCQLTKPCEHSKKRYKHAVMISLPSSFLICSCLTGFSSAASVMAPATLWLVPPSVLPRPLCCRNHFIACLQVVEVKTIEHHLSTQEAMYTPDSVRVPFILAIPTVVPHNSILGTKSTTNHQTMIWSAFHSPMVVRFYII